MENDSTLPTETNENATVPQEGEPPVDSSDENPEGVTHLDIPTDELSHFDAVSTEPEKPPRIKDLLFSHDYPSRFVTALSIIFGTLASICVVLLTYVIVNNHRMKKNVTNDDQQKIIAEPMIQSPLGHFQIVLKAENAQAHDYDLRVDIVAECSTDAACEFIKSKLVEARDLIHPILSSVTREEFLTLVGKNRIRRRISEQLNGIVHDGKVTEVHFTNLIIEVGR